LSEPLRGIAAGCVLLRAARPRMRRVPLARGIHPPCRNGYRLAKRQGKPNAANARKLRWNGRCCDLTDNGAVKRLRAIHRDA